MGGPSINSVLLALSPAPHCCLSLATTQKVMETAVGLHRTRCAWWSRGFSSEILEPGWCLCMIVAGWCEALYTWAGPLLLLESWQSWPSTHMVLRWMCSHCLHLKGSCVSRSLRGREGCSSTLCNKLNGATTFLQKKKNYTGSFLPQSSFYWLVLFFFSFMAVVQPQSS